jgi:nitrite reductase/ring-hydroxylating ferredoxin subunit
MADYIKVAKTSDLTEEEGLYLTANGKPIALFKVDGEYYCIDDTCPHQEGPLSEGYCDGTEVTCPWHHAVFDLKTGQCTEGPSEEDVNSYPVRVQGEDIEIQV